MKTLPAQLLYGADYNPEQWPRETWLEDVQLMQKAGVNMVSLGIFAWAQLEPRPGDYQFAWLDEVMDLLHAHGIMVNLATAVAAPPPWMAKRYPDSRPVTAEGVRLEVGARQGYCPSHPAFRQHAQALVRQLAQRYAQHPALRMWHINNEYGCHISECHCDLCAAQFRGWLQRRYTHIEGLNEAWGTAFWSQRYDDWSEIQPPRKAPTYPNPTQQLDWRRFSSDNLLELMQAETAIVREATPHLPVTTNFLGFIRGLDYFKWAQHEDLVSNDSYPDPADPHSYLASAMEFDLMRSLRRGERWILMEQAPSAVNWRAHNALKRPGQMRLISQQALARGARGILFFQWRASKAGAEKFHSGMVQHMGAKPSRVFAEISQLGAELQQLAFLAEAQMPSKVGLIFDWENRWALELDSKPSASLNLLEQTRKYYTALHRLGLPVDFVHPESDLSPYSLVVVPNLYLTTPTAAQNLERYVHNGGSVVMGFFSGIVDALEHIHLGGYPAPFRKMLGLWIEEWAVLQPGETRPIRLWDGALVRGSLWCDLMHLEGAQPLAHYQSDFYAGRPVIGRHAFGRGHSFYVGTDLEPAALHKLMQQVCKQIGLRYTDLPPGADAVVSQTRQGAILHLMNFAFEHSLEVQLPEGAVDVLSGANVPPKVVLEPFELRLLRYGQVDLADLGFVSLEA